MYKAVLASTLLASSLVFTGCAANDHPDKIPTAALRVTEGDGKVSYTTAADGTAYVYERGNNRIVWSGPIAANQTITVDPQADKITVGDRTAGESVLHSNHQHEIYFNAWAPQPAGQRVIVEHEKETVIERPRY